MPVKSTSLNKMTTSFFCDLGSLLPSTDVAVGLVQTRKKAGFFIVSRYVNSWAGKFVVIPQVY